MCQLSELIAHIGQTAPNAVALLSDQSLLPYGHLNQRANRLANHLRSLGVATGSTVAICQDRGFDQIVSALSVLRTGAAYVPVDPSWPDERVRHILADSGASVLLSPRDRAERLSLSIPTVCPVHDAGQIAASSPLFDHAPSSPEDLAYVIYTSGSTGTPKGVEITHANLGHLIEWHCKAFAVTSADRASHLAGLAFDASVWEVWPYLAAGGSLCLPPNDMVRTSSALLQQWLVKEQVTVAFVPTPLAEPMLSMHWAETTCLRYLLTGGDTLHAWPKPGQPFSVINNYGPTECTVVATSGVVDPPLPGRQAAGLPTLGRAIAGTQVYVLRADGTQAEVGEPGELYIGGNGVGRGYRNLPQLTATSFVPDTFSGTPGARLYKTGDGATLLADGQLTFLGRVDGQVKIRGQRIETGEIVVALGRHPSVAFNTIVAAGEGVDDKHLVAYVLPVEGAAPTAQELQQFLATTLPSAMIPSVFVRLASLPLTENGKVDLRRLPVPDSENALAQPSLPTASATTAPSASNPIEETIQTIVQTLLKVRHVGIDEDFFLIGGHSLLGTQLVLRIREAFDVSITLRDLFEFRSVSQLSKKVETLLLEELESMSEEEAARQVNADGHI